MVTVGQKPDWTGQGLSVAVSRKAEGRSAFPSGDAGRHRAKRGQAKAEARRVADDDAARYVRTQYFRLVATLAGFNPDAVRDRIRRHGPLRRKAAVAAE